MNIIDALHHRRSIREFTDAAVDPDLLRFLIATAVEAPNSVNRQAWSFTVVTDRALLENCSTRAKAHTLAGLAAAPHLVAHREHLAAPGFNIFYNAPALIVISATESDAMALQDCCLAAAYLMLAAFERGLGTCWIGFAESWLNQPEGKAALEIPPAHIAVAPIIVGYPTAAPPAPARRTPAVTWIGDQAEMI